MKNKGFTLIELLAVIVILAIIALIATPIVLNIISDAKQKSILRSAENYVTAIEQAVATKNLKGEYNPNYCVMEEFEDEDGIYKGLNCYDSNNQSLGELPTNIDGEIPTYIKIYLEDGKISKNTYSVFYYDDQVVSYSKEDNYYFVTEITDTEQLLYFSIVEFNTIINLDNGDYTGLVITIPEGIEDISELQGVYETEYSLYKLKAGKISQLVKNTCNDDDAPNPCKNYKLYYQNGKLYLDTTTVTSYDGEDDMYYDSVTTTEEITDHEEALSYISSSYDPSDYEGSDEEYCTDCITTLALVLPQSLTKISKDLLRTTLIYKNKKYKDDYANFSKNFDGTIVNNHEIVDIG